MDLGGGTKQYDVDASVEVGLVASSAIFASAEFLTAALQRARVGTWQMDTLTGLSMWDAVTSELLGLPRQPVLMGQRLPIHPHDKQKIWQRLKHRASEGGADDIEFRIICPDGAIRWMRAAGHQLDATERQKRYVAGIITDVTQAKAAAESLQEAEERYRLISQVTADLVFDWDLANDRFTWNEARGLFLGYSAEELSQMSALRSKIHPDDQGRVVKQFREVFASENARYTSDHRVQRADGNYADVHASGIIMRDRSGCATRVIGSIQDVTERRYADAALRESEAINRGIVEASSDSIVLLDLEGRLLFLNRSGGRTTTLEDFVAEYGQEWASAWPYHARAQIDRAVKVAAAGDTAQFTESFVHEGRLRWWEVVVSPIRDSTGVPIKLVAIARDITQRREADENLRRAATYDSLTNLPNRAFFQDRLSEALSSVCPSGRRVGLLLLDVDDFKQVNDSLGHDAGDALLVCLASRIEPLLANGIVARLGGDEFAVLLDSIENEHELAQFAHAILERAKEPLVYSGRVLDCHVTIGAALFPDHGSSPDELLKSADIALYVAKSSARGAFTIFEPAHRERLEQRIEMVAVARSALGEQRIIPFYQPKIAFSDHRISGFEALLRWRDPVRGMQLPATITAAFDDLEVATAISRSMIDQVIGDMRMWLDQGLSFGHIAVNAAAAEFRDDRFGESVLERLAVAQIPASCFQLEVTETVFLGKGAEYVDRALKLLDSEGVRIALDDFGTGYASLRHLKQFPVHVIKIDQSFVQGMTTDPEYAAIIAAVLNLGQSLDIEVVAEGIETAEQDRCLRELGCAFGQGFLYSEAVSADHVPALLGRFAAEVGFPKGE